MTDRQPAFTSDLAVVYLARFAEGAGPVAKFVESYRRHPAGTAHDLIVIRKGFPEDPAEQNAILAPLLANAISVSDEGFDITTYAQAAAQLPHEHVFFLNTFSEIAADDWLRHLHSAFADPEVGVAGSTGSYESLHSNMRRLKSGLFLAQRRFLPSPALMGRAFQTVRRLLPTRISKFLVARIISHFSSTTRRTTHGNFQNDAFEAFWIRETKAEGTYDYLHAIPKFPNPHIRTNAFMMKRQLFLDVLPKAITTKKESYLFESGPDSLTQQVLRRGKKVVVVGRDARAYNVSDWPTSGTFRLGDQSNLLVHDNQTRAFEALNSSGKRAFAEMTWNEDGSRSI